MKKAIFLAQAILVSGICCGISGAQLPNRSGLSEETDVQEELKKKAIDLLDHYDRNMQKINRFSCAIAVERTIDAVDKEAEFVREWLFFSQDREKEIRRTDWVFESPSLKPNSIELELSTSTFTTFETKNSISQRQTSTSSSGYQRDDDSGLTDDKYNEVIQQLPNAKPFLLPFFGVKLGNSTRPKRNWIADSSSTTWMKNLRVTGWHEDNRQFVVRFNVPQSQLNSSENMAYDITFSKSDGNMPSKLIRSFNGIESWKGADTTIKTTWVSHRTPKDGLVYLPTEVETQIRLPPSKPQSKEVNQASLYWVLDKAVPSSVFETSAELFLNQATLKDGILSNAINRK